MATADQQRTLVCRSVLRYHEAALDGAAPGSGRTEVLGFLGQREGWAPPPHPLVPTCQVGLLGFLMLLFLLDLVALPWVL